MMELIEKAGKAAFEAFGGAEVASGKPWEQQSEMLRQAFCDEAKAAIRAMLDGVEPVAWRYVHKDYAGRKVSRYGSHAERVNGHDPIEAHPLYSLDALKEAL